MTTEPAVTVDGLPAAFDQALPGRPELAEELLARWAEPHRRYHDRRHLAEVLTMIDRLAEPRHDRTSVRLAAWFHDAVHTGRAGEDERASADLAVDRLTALIGSDRAGEVARLVGLTAGHRVADDDHDGRLLCDADLAILAAVPQRYAGYAADVRQEYAHVPDDAFASGRARVLRGLLAAPLYGTVAGRALEARARVNVTAELERLERGEVAPVEVGPVEVSRIGPDGAPGSR